MKMIIHINALKIIIKAKGEQNNKMKQKSNSLRLPVCYKYYQFETVLPYLSSWDIFLCCKEKYIYIYAIGCSRAIIVII